MDFSLSEEQRLIQDSAAEFLGEFSDSKAVRRAMESERGWEGELWQRICAEMGWGGIAIAEEHGGLGLGQIELALILEQMGHHLLCAPFFSSICLAANTLSLFGNEAQRSEILPQLIAGSKTASLAWLPPGATDWRSDLPGVTASATSAGWTLHGKLSHVLNGHTADFLLVAAALEEEQRFGIFLLSADTPGLQRRRRASMDQTRPQAEIHLQDLHLPSSALLGELHEDRSSLERVLQLAAVALAAEQAGGARRCLQMTVAYTMERHQFGRPIASFQAVKHKCADMMLDVESMRSVAWHAACIADEFLAARNSAEELSQAASIAQSFCSEAFFRCAAENLQLHGGVGFTWEYDVHLYFKRARAMESFLGTPDWHRENIAALALEPLAVGQSI